MTSETELMRVAESEREERPPWWRPGLRHAAQRDVAGAIYGLILATSVIAVSRQYTHNAGVTAVTVVVTAGVFWLAHVYAGVLATELRLRHMPSWHDVRRIIDEQWPLVQSGILPTAVLLLGPLGVLSGDTAQDAAIGACLVELGATGLLVARAAGARGILVVVSGAISLSFGVVVIVLKVLVY
jgi:hypothetical protein